MHKIVSDFDFDAYMTVDCGLCPDQVIIALGELSSISLTVYNRRNKCSKS